MRQTINQTKLRVTRLLIEPLDVLQIILLHHLQPVALLGHLERPREVLRHCLVATSNAIPQPTLAVNFIGRFVFLQLQKGQTMFQPVSERNAYSAV